MASFVELQGRHYVVISASVPHAVVLENDFETMRTGFLFVCKRYTKCVLYATWDMFSTGVVEEVDLFSDFGLLIRPCVYDIRYTTYVIVPMITLNTQYTSTIYIIHSHRGQYNKVLGVQVLPVPSEAVFVRVWFGTPVL